MTTHASIEALRTNLNNLLDTQNLTKSQRLEIYDLLALLSNIESRLLRLPFQRGEQPTVIKNLACVGHSHMYTSTEESCFRFKVS